MHQHSNYRGPRRRREKKGGGTEKIFEEIIVENVHNMGKEMVNQVQEAQRVPNRINPRRNTPRHILIKLSKIKYKEKTLKAAREKLRILFVLGVHNLVHLYIIYVYSRRDPLPM